MKKIAILLAMGLSLTLVLAACNKAGDSSSVSAASGSTGSSATSASSASTAGSTASASGSSLPASGAPASSAAPTAASGSAASASGTNAGTPADMAVTGQAAAPAANFAGTYNAYDTARYPDDRAPYLELSDKGGFVLHFNLGDGRLAVMTGTYTSSGGGLSLDVMYCDSTDFLGQDIRSLSFTVDGSNLVYNSAPLGMSRSGDSFTRRGATGGAAGEAGGKNMYILEPGRVLEGGLPLSPSASSGSMAAPPTATASVAPAASGA